ncbi:hypothetical protein [Paenibacillus sp. Leaf72]|uniref:hypothetical protein n=1 Tax=Paenibacillus sp. Leaf72 TaxID=1736234 RepID=UPI0006FD1629|nr:hypothetical protein [Paenibacillus sp. Leaf72]KQN96885.1 hypothetical protein ASF12_22720 [Paenibacillus sp. Leaf72]
MKNRQNWSVDPGTPTIIRALKPTTPEAYQETRLTAEIDLSSKIAEVNITSQQEQSSAEAIARLMAASPELLHALERLRDTFDFTSGYNPEILNHLSADRVNDVFRDCLQAIEKASY